MPKPRSAAHSWRDVSTAPGCRRPPLPPVSFSRVRDPLRACLKTSGCHMVGKKQRSDTDGHSVDPRQSHPNTNSESVCGEGRGNRHDQRQEPPSFPRLACIGLPLRRLGGAIQRAQWEYERAAVWGRCLASCQWARRGKKPGPWQVSAPKRTATRRDLGVARWASPRRTIPSKLGSPAPVGSDSHGGDRLNASFELATASRTGSPPQRH